MFSVLVLDPILQTPEKISCPYPACLFIPFTNYSIFLKGDNTQYDKDKAVYDET